jgi:glycosidase
MTMMLEQDGTGRLSDGASSPWWRNAVTYQVYVSAFADSNGDGIGDLAGVTARIPHLARLGVDALWLTPHYPSPGADGGYDISDHMDVHPEFGTIEDYDELIAVAHAAGLRVLIDIVPNHVSDQHPWFRDALAGVPGARDRFHFPPGRPTAMVPSAEARRCRTTGNRCSAAPPGPATSPQACITCTSSRPSSQI